MAVKTSIARLLTWGANSLLGPFSVKLSPIRPPKPPKPPKLRKPPKRPKPQRRPKPADVRVDLRGSTDDPIAAAYRSGGAPFILDVALERMRLLTPLLVPCARNSGNPFVDTVASYARGEATSYENTPLRTFYETWRPANAAEAIGLETSEASPELLATSPFGAVLPWQPSENLAERVTKTEKAIERDNRAHGETLNCAAGHKFFGPVSPAKGQLEFVRLIQTYESIRKNGYVQTLSQRFIYPAINTVLVGEDEWVGLVLAGHHRLPALVVLDWVSTPITFKSKIPLIVRRADVDRWPGVVSGLFSQDQAFALFDRVMAGKPPSNYSARDEARTVPQLAEAR